MVGRGVCRGITGTSCGLSAPGRRRGTWRGGPLPEVATASLERGQAWPRSSRLQRPFDHTDFQITPSPSSGSLAHTCLCPSPPAEPWAGRDRPQAVRTLHPSPHWLRPTCLLPFPAGGALIGALHPALLTCPAPAHPGRGTHGRPALDVWPFPTHCLEGKEQVQHLPPHCSHPGPSPRLQQLPQEDRYPGSPSS